MKKRVLFIAAGVVVVAASLLVFQSQKLHMETFTDFVMGSILTQNLWTGDLGSPGEEADCIVDVCRALEEELNNTAEAPALALEIMEASGRAFTPYLGVLTKLWDIDGQAYVPSREEINEALKQLEVDLGAYGKGAACDAALRVLENDNYNVTAAVINLGGNILTYGKKPWNQPFKIALRDPKGGPNDTMGVFTLRGTNFISTSGSYEKFFERDGKRYHHIFDPQTGYPAERELGLISVTVINGNGAIGDMVSTACFVLGYEASLDLLAQYNCDALFIYEDGRVKNAGNAWDYFKLENASFYWDYADIHETPFWFW